MIYCAVAQRENGALPPVGGKKVKRRRSPLKERNRNHAASWWKTVRKHPTVPHCERLSLYVAFRGAGLPPRDGGDTYDKSDGRTKQVIRRRRRVIPRFSRSSRPRNRVADVTAESQEQLIPQEVLKLRLESPAEGSPRSTEEVAE